MGLAGNFLIGSITTSPFSIRYEPTTYTNTGATTLQTPAAAYDNDVTTAATVIVALQAAVGGLMYWWPWGHKLV